MRLEDMLRCLYGFINDYDRLVHTQKKILCGHQLEAKASALHEAIHNLIAQQINRLNNTRKIALRLLLIIM